jgi:hypothetical protein
MEARVMVRAAKAWISLDRHAQRISGGEAGDRHACAGETRCAFEKHEGDRRVHELDRRM